MKTTKGERKKGSDMDKEIARPSVEFTNDTKGDTPSNISPDPILAEKDEEKMAEERLRQKNK